MPAVFSDYEVLEIIGTGSYGVCKKIRRKKDGRVRARSCETRIANEIIMFIVEFAIILSETALYNLSSTVCIANDCTRTTVPTLHIM